jgi:hypothetical protein
MILRRGAVLVVLVGLLTGCAAFLGIERQDPFAIPPEYRLRVMVRNLSTETARIAAITMGRSLRLGDVPGGSESEFSLRWEGIANVQFSIEFEGGQVHTTERARVRAGQVLEVWVRAPVQASTLSR